MTLLLHYFIHVSAITHNRLIIIDIVMTVTIIITESIFIVIITIETLPNKLIHMLIHNPLTYVPSTTTTQLIITPIVVPPLI